MANNSQIRVLLFRTFAANKESWFRAIDAIGGRYKFTQTNLAIFLVPRLDKQARKWCNAISDNVRFSYDDSKNMMCMKLHRINCIAFKLKY